MSIEFLGPFGLGALAAFLIAGLFVRQFLPAYFTEKGKNLATKEDMAAITHEVERVKNQYAALLEGLKTRNSLRVAAIDKRLQVHQEAFTHWRELMSKTHTDDVGKEVLICQTWWEQNCLYLEPEVRSAFVDAYSAAAMHNQLVRSRPEYTVVQENWKRVTRFPDLLFAAVQLPSLTKIEVKTLELAEPSGDATGA